MQRASATSGTANGAPSFVQRRHAAAMLCVPLTGTTIEQQLDQSEEARKEGADLVEIRLDYLTDLDSPDDLLKLLRRCSLPSIVTFRPKWEG